MVKFTLAVYRYFQQHRWLMYLLLTTSTLLFLFFALQVRFEEDITKLLPASSTIGDSEQLVFNHLKVKDKIFIQMRSRSGETDLAGLNEACDEFMDSLLTHDTGSHIDHILYQVDMNWLTEGAGYAYHHIPLFLEESDYAVMDSLLQPDALEVQMQANVDLVMEGRDLFVAADPAGIRYALKSKSQALSQAFGGQYRIIDQHFYTPDSTVLVAFLSPNFAGFDSKSGNALVKQIESEIEQLQQTHPDLEVLFHGSPVRSVCNARQIKRDLVFTIGLSLLLAILLVWYCFSNKGTLLWLLLPIGYGMLLSLCALYFIQGTMSLMAMGIGAIVLGVALSYCLHVVTHYKYVNDPELVIREQTTPVILGSLTTIGAFMGLVFTDSALLRDFGLFATFALIGTTLFCLLFLPHFFKARGNRHSEKAFKLIEKINTYPFERNKPWVAALCVLCIVGVSCAHLVSFDTDLKNIGFSHPRTVRSEQLLAEKTNHGNANLYFAVTAAEMSDALSANAVLQQHLAAMRDSGLIVSYAATSQLLIPDSLAQARIQRWKNYWTEQHRTEVRQRIAHAGSAVGFDPEAFQLFYDLMEEEPADDHLLEAGVLPDEIAGNFAEYTDGKWLLFTSVQMDPARTKEVCDALTPLPHTVVIDPFYYMEDMVRILRDDFNIILWISSLFVLIVLLLSFRSIPLALIAFLPMTMSWFVVEGLMGLTGLSFNLLNIVVSSFIFGVGVDYSIFILDGLLAETCGKSQLLLQHKTAILLSATVLIISISSLIFAVHPALESIGFITLIGMLSTIGMAYTLEPLIFHALMKTKFFNRIVERRNRQTA
ncbi:MAG: MMPL family transporter [Paludibacteraceae bacterium]|nr:MMPL family transporter [Paludibacteraceae bacterium]